MAAQTDELPVERVADPDLVCGIDGCAFVGKGKIPKLSLGRHRFQVHGVRTKSAAPKAARARSVSRPKEPREPTVSRRARSAATSVTKSARRLGVIVSPRLPIAGAYAMANATELGDLLAEVAEGNTKLLEWLEKSEDAAAWIGLAWWTAGFAYAVGVDLERFPEEGTMAEELGVTEIVRKVDRALDERERRLRAAGVETEEKRAEGAFDVEPVEDGDRSPPSVLGAGTGPRSQNVAAG